ncbi:MAG: lysophospholipid acyltransferase family protein [Gammaproteobacteria bacterium]|nr:lysophospholipid acyltransferase family protein [Gammaproteobacteria bacterium]
MTPGKSARDFLSPRYWPTWLMLGVLWPFSLLPMWVVWLLGQALGTVLYLLHARGRRIARRNLALCFPALPAAARARLLRRHYRALGQAVMGVSFSWWGSARRQQKLVRIRARESYDQALAAGRPVILLAPHFLAMELGGMRLAQERPMISMYKQASNALIDWLMRRRRLRYGGLLVERDAPLRPLIRQLRAGEPFYYLPDQNPGEAAHVFAPFFGVPAATVTALARIARLADAVVIPCFTRQLPYGRGYEVYFKPPLADFPSGDELADATRMNQAIEEGVREMPEQYLWTYKRFKHRPSGEPSLYG